MTRTRMVGTMGAALAALLLGAAAARPAPAPGAPAGLDQVPATAPLVLHLRGVEGTKDRLLALLKNALPDVYPMVQPKVDEWFKDGIDGRKLSGLPKDGPIFVAFTELPKPGEEPKVAVILAVTKYAEFRDNVLKEGERKNLKADGAGVEKTTLDNGEAVYFVDKKGYAVVCPTEDVAKAFTKKQAGLDGRMSKELAAKFLAGDLGLYLSMDAFNKQYADQIKQAREGAEEAIKAVAENAPKAQKGLFEMTRNIIGPVFQAVEDSQGILVTLEFRPGGLAFHAQTEIRPGSPTAGALAGAKLSAFPELARMPAGKMIYDGIQTSPALFKALGALLFGALTESDGKGAKAVQQALEQLAKANPGTRIDAASVPPSALTVWHYEEPAKAMEAQLQLLKALYTGDTSNAAMLKGKPVIKAGAEKYAGFTLHSVQLVWDFDKMIEQGGAGLPDEAKKQMAEGYKKMLGEKMNLWFGTDGKVMVQVAAKDWAGAQRLLDQYAKGAKRVGDVPAFRDVRKELPAEATMLGVVDMVQYLGVVADFAKPLLGNFMPLPPGFPAAGKGQPTYVGGALTLRPQRGSVDGFISAASVHEFYQRFIKPLRPPD
jgi:hypothetical protein